MTNYVNWANQVTPTENDIVTYENADVTSPNEPDILPFTDVHTYDNEKFAEDSKIGEANATVVESFTISSLPNDDDEKKKRKMLYEIDDIPSWYLTLFLGFQHYLLMAGATLSLPLVLMPAMCMPKNDPDMGNIISTFLFVSGIVTILQSTFGTRLPIIQGGSFAYLIPALAILDTERWKCPENLEDDTLTWQDRMRELQGAIILSSLLQIGLGFFGVFGVIMKFITPITLASSVIIIGVSLFEDSSHIASSNWPLSLLTIILVIAFSQYFREFKIPIPFTKSKKRQGMLRYPMFQIFPVLLTIVLVWVLCAVLTACDVFAEDSLARTDKKMQVVYDARPFRVPFPFQWGVPTVSAGAFIGFLSAVFAGIVESLGEYHAAARICRAPKPPVHSINRGVFMEGIGCLLMGMFGTGNGTTSYSENTGAMSITKVGSRRVVQTAGFFMMVFSLFAPLGAFFVAVPDPIVGGILCVTFSMIVAVGVSNLHNVDLTSTRNMFILGFSIFFSLAVSKWVKANPNRINFGHKEVNFTIQILLRTGMFIAALTSCFLDNTIPGTLEERGLTLKSVPKKTAGSGEYDMCEYNEDVENVTYDLPFGMKFFRRYRFFSWFPISPTFEGFHRKSQIS